MQSSSFTFSAAAAGYNAPAAAMNNNFFGSWSHGTSNSTSPFGLQNPLLAGTSWLAETQKQNPAFGQQASSAFEQQPSSSDTDIEMSDVDDMSDEYVDERKERKMREKEERKEKIRVHRAPRVDPVWEFTDMFESLQISEPEPKKTKKGLSVRFAETVVTDVKIVQRYLPAGKGKKLRRSKNSVQEQPQPRFRAIAVPFVAQDSAYGPMYAPMNQGYTGAPTPAYQHQFQTPAPVAVQLVWHCQS